MLQRHRSNTTLRPGVEGGANCCRHGQCGSTCCAAAPAASQSPPQPTARYTPSLLRGTLRMMRGPAAAAGLAELQHFLEQGFDTFKSMKGAQHFLGTVRQREEDLAAKKEREVSTRGVYGGRI